MRHHACSAEVTWPVAMPLLPLLWKVRNYQPEQHLSCRSGKHCFTAPFFRALVSYLIIDLSHAHGSCWLIALSGVRRASWQPVPL